MPARKPKISDAEGWTKAIGMNNDTYRFVEIYIPTGLTVSNTSNEWRFSYVNEEIVLRNWFKVVVPGRRDKYFYGERAYSEAMNYASDEDWELERAANGWS